MQNWVRKKAFSLVEILTVIALILVITAIIVPVYANSRRSALILNCSSNLRQIGLASAIYAVDHDDTRAYATHEIGLWFCRGGITDSRCGLREDGATIERLILTPKGFKHVTHCPLDAKDDRLYTSGEIRPTSYVFSAVLFLNKPHPNESTAGQALAWDYDKFHGDNRVNTVFADGHAKNLDWDTLHRRYTDQAEE